MANFVRLIDENNKPFIVNIDQINFIYELVDNYYHTDKYVIEAGGYNHCVNANSISADLLFKMTGITIQ